MATAPQRHDPDEQRPRPEPVADNFNRVEREVGTGKPFTWAWLWIPIVIAAFWFVGWGWGPYGGWWWGHGSESATQSANSTAPAPPNTSAQPANGAPAGGSATAANAAGNSGQTGARAGVASGPAAPAAQITGTGVAALDAVNKSSYIGQPFQISNVPVEKKAGSRAFWIGAGNTGTAGPMLLVLPSGSSINAGVGDRITASGKVVKAPPASQARRPWSIGGDDAQQLEKEGAYIQASTVRLDQP